MTAEWDDLARLAEAATPGPWQRSGTYVETVPEFDLHRFDTMGVDVAKAHLSVEDAEFIAAANPATILRLITERDAMAARLTAVEAELQQQRHRTAEFQTIAAGFANRAVAAEDRLAAVEALTEEPEMALDSIQIRHRYVDIRAALSAAPTDTTKEN